VRYQPSLDLTYAYDIDEIPTIHADGKHDDSPGWVAAVENRRVTYDGRIYEPGDPLTIDREMHFIFNICTLGADQDMPSDIDETWIVARIPTDGMRDIYYTEGTWTRFLRPFRTWYLRAKNALDRSSRQQL
jgi:hypothetical protein